MPGRIRVDSHAPRLIVVAGPHVGRVFPLARASTIGRDPEANITIDDPRLSRVHARLSRSPLGTWAIDDLGSRNGVFVNGVRVSSKALEFGNEVSIGSSVFLFTHHNPLEEELLQKQRMEILGRLGAGIAHDFNNLLGAAVADMDYLTMLEPGAALNSTDVADCLADVRKALRRAADLSGNLVNVSRRRGYVLERTDLAALCDEVVSLLRRTLPCTITINIEAARGLEILVDAGQIHQLLMNLCINARDALPRGGTITITAGRAPARSGFPQMANEPGGVLLTVTDDGVGMSDETRRRAFDPFYSRKTGGGGTGLGLATVLEIVKFHGGHVELISTPGRGTTVRMILPPAPDDTQRQGGETRDDLATFVLTPEPEVPAGCLRILVIDDNKLIQKSIGRVLTRQGHHVISAMDGEEGLQLFASERPDLVLLDLDMPRLPGNEVYKRLKQLVAKPRVVLMSGHAATILDRSPEWAGEHPPFLQKPWGPSDLTDAIRAAVAD